MFRNVRRFLGIALIVSAIVVTQIPAKEAYASYAKEDFLMDKDTLSKYTGTAATVSVSDDVKVIGEEAFAGNQYIGTVNLGKNLKGIEHGAFANCNYLNKVRIPDTVEYIDSAVFSGCTSLQNITFGKKVEKVGDAVFAGCKNLVSVSIPKENENFKTESGVLYDNRQEYVYAYLCGNAFDTYKMPNSVKHISQYSFWGNEDLIDVYLSGNLEEIPGYSFSNCKNLQNIQIPYSVNSIDAKAFENCVSLKDVEIPPSVQYIDPTAFDGCVNLNIIAVEGSAAYDFFKNFDASDVASSEIQDAKEVVKNGSNGVVTNGAHNGVSYEGLIDASKDPSNIEWMPSVDSLSYSEDDSVLGKTIVVSGRAVFFINREMPVKQLDSPSVSFDTSALTSNESVSDNSVSDSVSSPSNDSADKGSAIYDSGKGGYLPKYTEVNGKIAGLAYYASKDMEDYHFPSGIKEIGKFSFARSNIDNVVIPEGVNSIDYGAFYHCDNLSNVSIPSSVESIDAYAFENTPFLKNFKANIGGNNFLTVGDGLLLAYNGDESRVVIPNGVKKICAGAFYNNQDIESVYIPSSVESIEPDAFRNCKKLNVIEDASGVEYIGDRAFMNCPIGSFVIGEKVERMGLRAIDFSETDKTDSSKVVLFEGKTIPTITSDETSRRLANDEYREDVLYNCLFAVVDEDVNDFEGTVLDGNKLGFSGLIVSLEKDENGRDTGFANIKANYIFSDEVLKKIPNSFAIKGINYIINGYDKLTVSPDIREKGEGQREVKVITNGDANNNFSAKFSEREDVGVLSINSSDEAKKALLDAYGELFGGKEISIDAYDIKLSDSSDTINIDKFGKSVLYITVPVSMEASKYHVITLDEDGQLEELNAVYSDEKKNITFEATHLSYIGVYGNDGENVMLNVKDGVLIRNYRLDKSPDTGDTSIPIKYVGALFLLSFGLLLFLINPRKKKIA